MSYYLAIYIFSITFSIIAGALVFRRHRNISGFFFLLFTILLSIWFLLYFLFFSGIENTEILLHASRLAFGISIAGIYSLLFFIKNFQHAKGEFLTRKTGLILLLYGIVIAIFFFTPAIVAGLYYDSVDHVYREIYGKFYLIHVTLSILFVPLFIFFAAKQIRTQSYLGRIRLKNILFSAFILITFGFTFQLILPMFGIWLFEKELIFLFLFFVLSVAYTVKRYYFSGLGYGTGRIMLVIASIGSSILFLNGIKNIYRNVSSSTNSYWILRDGYSIIDTMLGILLFTCIYWILRKIFLGETVKVELKSKIHKLEKHISYLTHIHDLEKYLKMEMRRIFKTNFCELRMFPESDLKNEIQKYFEKSLTDRIFINDIVFIEEKKNKFHKEKLLEEIPEESFLVLPIFDADGGINTGIFIVGVKSFGDFYTTQEIDILRDFVAFLDHHLKYIKTYELFQDLSVNLDKKVDEKTMEYNNLINKQKEFISVISHEIKSPLANAIFQADSIIDDMEDASFPRETIKRELRLLNEELIKTGELTAKLFSVQYFDTRAVTLFLERVQIAHLLQVEHEVYSRMHEQIRFIDEIDDTMGFVEIDKIQFQQVITNLLQNAIKFLDKKDSVIILQARKEKGVLSVIIEDNGRGFQGIDIENLFDRYITGSGESIGLGMGLYLCKKIIDMHGGTIVASLGERLGGAKFSIKIPLN